MEPTKGIADYINVERLQKVQDICSKALGIAVVTVDYRGVPITTTSGFTRHCALGRREPRFRAMCERCDAFGGIRSTTMDGPCFYRCHAGLVDFAAPLVVDDNYLGGVIAGQVKILNAPDGAIESVIPEYTSPYASPELLQARDQIPFMSYERLIASANTIRMLISALLAQELGRDEKKMASVIRDKDRELVSLRGTLDDVQRTLYRRNAEHRRLDEAYKCFFPVMSELHELACQEGASSTDALLLDFVDVSRYILENETDVVTLGEEAGHVEMLLRILSWRYEGLLDYSVRVPERLSLTPCPFMVLRPVVLAAVQDPWGAAPRGGCEVHLGVREGEDSLTVWVVQNSLSTKDAQHLIEERGDGTSFSLADAKRRLEKMGAAGGFRVEGRRDDKPGCVISFDLPVPSSEG